MITKRKMCRLCITIIYMYNIWSALVKKREIKPILGPGRYSKYFHRYLKSAIWLKLAILFAEYNCEIFINFTRINY